MAKLTEERKAEAVRRYQQGQDFRLIAFALDMGHGSIRQALTEAGVEIRPSRSKTRIVYGSGCR